MKKRFVRQAVNTALAFALSTTMWAPSARAQSYDLRNVIVGHWHQQVGNMVIDSIYQANGRFSAMSNTPGVGSFFAQGTWNVENGNILVLHNLDWSPKVLHNVGGGDSPLVIPEWERDPIQILDNNHVRNELGTAVRVK